MRTVYSVSHDADFCSFDSQEPTDGRGRLSNIKVTESRHYACFPLTWLMSQQSIFDNTSNFLKATISSILKHTVFMLKYHSIVRWEGSCAPASKPEIQSLINGALRRSSIQWDFLEHQDCQLWWYYHRWIPYKYHVLITVVCNQLM